MTLFHSTPALLSDVINSPEPFADSSDLRSWLVYFALTLVIECGVILAVWRVIGRPGRLRNWMFATLAGNVVSHPIASAAFLHLGRTSSASAVMLLYLAIECGVVLIESVAYRHIAPCDWGRAWKVSLLVNLPTAALGFAISFLS